MTSLYNLSQQYQKLLHKEEYTEEDMVELDNIHGFVEDKVISCACILNELKGNKHATIEAIRIAQGKAERIQKNIETLEKKVLDTMINNHIEKVSKHPLFDVIVRTNRSAVDDYDKKQIPYEYWSKTEVFTVNKIKIRDDIENLGLAIPGAQLIKKKVLKIL